MCGIVGYLDSAVQYPDQILKRMTEAIIHRGPDDEGHWFDHDAGIALGHRRLSILDLSPAGHQPMHSNSGRYVVVFNGEIYNHHLIRAELEQLASRNWRGRSDTEVMLEAFETWGLEATLKRLVGMFAIALWDRRERLLYLIRDRIGEKPLYYGWCGDAFLFGSELKAFKAHPAFKPEIDRSALMLYMRYCYVPAPYTIYKGIHKLIPGTTFRCSMDGPKAVGSSPVPYWSACTSATQGLQEPFKGTEQEAVSALESLLLDSVGKQMVADVPLGAFLSGGVDSSAVVAMMQAQCSRPVRTFTIGFCEDGYNEAINAKKVARHLGTDHTELYVSSDDALRVIPKLPDIYDEPFADSSQIPTFLVSQLTRKHVTVSLSGDAGDELFGGYNRYTWGKVIWDQVGWMPQAMRQGIAHSLTALSPQSWDKLFNFFGLLLPSRLKHRLPGDKIHKLARVMGVSSPTEIYHRLVSTWNDPYQIVPGALEPLTTVMDNGRLFYNEDIVLQMMYLDLVTYLPDDILVKVDRAAMCASLETRVPFLDHRVVEFAWRIPLSMKIRNGEGKWLLRQVLYKYVPRELIERPKTGFGVPIDSWLRGTLRDWSESLLNEKRLRDEGFFNPVLIMRKWQEHISGKRNWQQHLWDVLMFQAWLETHI